MEFPRQSAGPMRTVTKGKTIGRVLMQCIGVQTSAIKGSAHPTGRDRSRVAATPIAREVSAFIGRSIARSFGPVDRAGRDKPLERPTALRWHQDGGATAGKNMCPRDLDRSSPYQITKTKMQYPTPA
jgi:hypothetical protein